MSGTLLATPMVSSAEEVGNNSSTSSTNTSESTAGTGSTATVSENTAGTGSTTSTSAALAGTGSAVESAALAGTGSTTSTSATAGTGSPAGTVTEAPVDPSTTLPNNVDTVIPSDEMKGTKIESSIWGRHIEYDPDLGIEPAPIGPDETEIKVNISPEESKGEETLSPTFGSDFFDLDTPDHHPSRDVHDALQAR